MGRFVLIYICRILHKDVRKRLDLCYTLWCVVCFIPYVSNNVQNQRNPQVYSNGFIWSPTATSRIERGRRRPNFTHFNDTCTSVYLPQTARLLNSTSAVRWWATACTKVVHLFGFRSTSPLRTVIRVVKSLPLLLHETVNIIVHKHLTMEVTSPDRCCSQVDKLQWR